MKARLVRSDNKMELLLCTGKILSLTPESAKEFLMNFGDQSYYKGSTKWDYEGITMESYRGETIALVDDKGILCVHNAAAFKGILAPSDTIYLTVPEYAKVHGKQPAIVRRFCGQGRITGAIQKGNTWLIPEDAPYPADERCKK